MEKRILKTLFSKSGSGSENARITLPISWVREMGITEHEREVEISFDKETKEIKIHKKD